MTEPSFPPLRPSRTRILTDLYGPGIDFFEGGGGWAGPPATAPGQVSLEGLSLARHATPQTHTDLGEGAVHAVPKGMDYPPYCRHLE